MSMSHFLPVNRRLKNSHIIPAIQCKNLFLKDDKKNLYLVVAVSDTSHETLINLKKLSKYLNAPGLRFTDTIMLEHYLRVKPGSVTPFGLIFDVHRAVKVLLDATLFTNNNVGFHPLENTATTVITPQDLIIFIKSCGNDYMIINFTDIS